MFQEQRSQFLFPVQQLEGPHIEQHWPESQGRMRAMQSNSSDLLANQMLSLIPGRSLQCVYIASLPVLQTAFHRHKPSEQLFIKNNIAQGYLTESSQVQCTNIFTRPGLLATNFNIYVFWSNILCKLIIQKVVGSHFSFIFLKEFLNRTNLILTTLTHAIISLQDCHCHHNS